MLYSYIQKSPNGSAEISFAKSLSWHWISYTQKDNLLDSGSRLYHVKSQVACITNVIQQAPCEWWSKSLWYWCYVTYLLLPERLNLFVVAIQSVLVVGHPLAEVILNGVPLVDDAVLAQLKHCTDVVRPVEYCAVQLDILNWNTSPIHW